MQAPVPTLAVVTYPPGALSTQARIVIDGVRGAIFVYSNGGPLGALIGSWASTAGTDPYGNVYPQGLSVTLGAITGTNLIIKNSFGATILYISQAQDGMFVYADTGSATQGALIASATGKAGSTDPVNGGPFLQGINSYLVLGGHTYAISMNLPSGAGFPGVSVQDLVSSPNQVAGYFAESNGTTTALAFLTSGAATAADVASFIQAYSQVQSSVPGGQIVLQAGDVQIDDAGSLADMTVNATDGSLQIQNNTFGDGDLYKAGHKVVTMASNQAITSTSPVIITNMQFNVATGFNYRMFFQVIVSSDTNTTGGLTIGFDGSSVSGNANGRATIYQSGVNTPSTVIFDGSLAAFNTFSPAVALTRQIFDIEIWVSFTTGGAFNVRAQLTAAAATYHIKSAIGWKEIAA